MIYDMKQNQNNRLFLSILMCGGCLFLFVCEEFDKQYAKHSKQILYMNHANCMGS